MFVVVESVFAASGEWVKEGDYYKYKKNGEFLVSEWENIDGQDYYFTSDGYMAVGIVEIGNKYCAFDENGIYYKQGSTIDIMGKKCNIGEKGKIVKMPDDYTPEDLKAYNESVAAKKIEDASVAAAAKAFNEDMARQASVAAAKAATETKPITPIGDAAYIAPTEKASPKDNATQVTYTISTADEAKLEKAANTGATFDVCSNNLLVEVKTQVNTKVLEMKNEYSEALKVNPLLDVTEYTAKFDAMVAAYSARSEEILLGLKSKYTANSTKYEKADSKFQDAFEKIVIDFTGFGS